MNAQAGRDQLRQQMITKPTPMVEVVDLLSDEPVLLDLR